MTWHPDESLLQDHLEELLLREEELRVRSHLEGCAACRAELEGLGELRARLGSLPQEAQPSRDLWPQIAWRVSGAEVGKGEARPSRRRIALTAWQLLAASLTVAIVSGGAVWAFFSSPSGNPVAPEVAPATAAQMAGLPEAMVLYDDAVADLEGVLEQGRDVLDEETIQALEESINIIDSAIRDAQEALALDPASGVLQRILAENLRRKMELLRQAATAVYANS